MTIRCETHVPGSDGNLCGHDGVRAASYEAPTCKRCADLRAGAHRLYVALARHVLKRRATVSAGEVAFLAAGKRTRQIQRLMQEAEEAMSEAGLKRAYSDSDRDFGVRLWRAS